MKYTQLRQEDWQKIVYFSVKRFKKQRLAKRWADQEVYIPEDLKTFSFQKNKKQ